MERGVSDGVLHVHRFHGPAVPSATYTFLTWEGDADMTAFVEAAAHAETTALFADNLVHIARLGVEMIGGCCGTTAEHIRAVRRELDRDELSPRSPDASGPYV